MFRLTKGEEHIMMVMWAENRPLTRLELIELLSETDWTPSNVHHLIASLERKGLVKATGSVKVRHRNSKTYTALISKAEYGARQLTDNNSATRQEPDVPSIVAALIDVQDIDSDTLAEIQRIIDLKRRELEQ